jgi:hypothetical protein
MSSHCALTRKSGAFVKSHLLPRAFTDKALDQLARIEFGAEGQRPTLKYTSWFDSKLVTCDGEIILSKYDDEAAKELRRLGLTWRYFPTTQAATRHSILESFEYIEVKSQKTNELRMFFLSVLWRFTASRLPRFRDMKLDPGHQERLRQIVAREVDPLPHDFPAVLVLMTTKGQPQVQSPYPDIMAVPAFGDFKGDTLEIFRFFFDGLIVHMGRRPADSKLFDAWSPRVVGSDDALRIIGRSYEGSFQETNIAALQHQLHQQWPDDARRIYGAI